LHWQTPGRVWAADFTEPSFYGTARSLPPIAGRYPYVLAVRDLATSVAMVQCWPRLAQYFSLLRPEVTVVSWHRDGRDG
jgi:hypothetical protein